MFNKNSSRKENKERLDVSGINHKKGMSRVLVILIFSIVLFITLICCSKNIKMERVVIWTNCSEFAQYTELFNKTHKNNKAVIVYKENPAASLPPEEDEQIPDIIIGPWLRNDNVKYNFKSLDYCFDNQVVSSDIFYPQMLESGAYDTVQYLFPVSFNLPTVIFSSENKDLISDNYTLSLEQIREIAGKFNEKNKKGAYTKIGFTPLSNDNFLYLAAKLRGVDFMEIQGNMSWNSSELQKTADFLKDWIITENTSPQIEQDFAFKYLFMPNYRQVTSGRTLFAYTTSDELPRIAKDQNIDIDYRWIAEDKKIPMEDSYTMMGIYKKCKNQVGATEFISWFFNAQNQRSILERKEKMNLEVEQFGIAGGFSAVREVTEYILPVFYTQLLTNIPNAQMISVVNPLPAKWESYKELVVNTYLKNYICASEDESIPSIPELERDWQKKVFD